MAMMACPKAVNTMLYNDGRFQPGRQRLVWLLGGFLAYNHGTRLGTSGTTQSGMVRRRLQEGKLPDPDRGTVLLVGQNLFFLGRVETQADPLGYEVRGATTESAFWDIYRGCQPALILVDLEGDESIWSQVLEGLDHQETRGAKLVAFGPHENVALLERAKVLGCDLVLNKGEFNRDLPKILQGLGGDAETP